MPQPFWFTTMLDKRPPDVLDERTDIRQYDKVSTESTVSDWHSFWSSASRMFDGEVLVTKA